MTINVLDVSSRIHVFIHCCHDCYVHFIRVCIWVLGFSKLDALGVLMGSLDSG